MMITLVQVPGRTKWHVVNEQGETLSTERTLDYASRVAAWLVSGTPPRPMRIYGRDYQVQLPEGVSRWMSTAAAPAGTGPSGPGSRRT